MRIKLDDNRKEEISRALSDLFARQFDEEISQFRASEVVDFMLAQIGPSQYNQAIADARKFMQQRLDDLDVEFHEPEDI